MRRGGKALGSSGVGGGRISAWAPWKGPRVGGTKQRSALRVCFPLRSFFLPTSSIFLLRLRLRVLWVVSSDTLFAHGTCLLGLCEPRVYTLAVIGWKARNPFMKDLTKENEWCSFWMVSQTNTERVLTQGNTHWSLMGCPVEAEKDISSSVLLDQLLQFIYLPMFTSRKLVKSLH